MKKDWFIYYRFYDPSFRQNPKYSKGKLVVLKGMNLIQDHLARVAKTKEILQQELNELENKAYNPIANKSTSLPFIHSEIAPSTPFQDAIRLAEARLTCAPSTRRDLKSTINSVITASTQLKYAEISIGNISRKHIKQILLHIDCSLGSSPHRYNKIRSYLMVIYNELLELEAVDYNPVKDISKKKTIHRLKNLPTVELRRMVIDYLKLNHREFWVFTQIFFHSGARLTEMMLIKKSNVNLEAQTFRIIIKKGHSYKEVDKPIKNIALPYWQAVLSNAKEDDYLFSEGLIPGPTSIKSYQITKRWNRLIKKRLGVQFDYYTFKHLNLDETAALIGLSDASAMASHSSTKVTLKHYTLNENQRQMDRLIKVSNEL